MTKLQVMTTITNSIQADRALRAGSDDLPDVTDELPTLVIAPEQADSPELAEQFNALCKELDGICKIESASDGLNEVVAYIKGFAGKKRKCYLGALPVNATVVQALAHRIEVQELKRKLYELEPRMLAVGWNQPDITMLDQFSIFMDGERLLWDFTQASINAVTERLVTAEAKQLLDRHYAEISASGIGLTNQLPAPVAFPSFGFVLRENDALTIRRLTVDNVKEVIAIARALNELHSD